MQRYLHSWKLIPSLEKFISVSYAALRAKAMVNFVNIISQKIIQAGNYYFRNNNEDPNAHVAGREREKSFAFLNICKIIKNHTCENTFSTDRRFR